MRHRLRDVIVAWRGGLGLDSVFASILHFETESSMFYKTIRPKSRSCRWGRWRHIPHPVRGGTAPMRSPDGCLPRAKSRTRARSGYCPVGVMGFGLFSLRGRSTVIRVQWLGCSSITIVSIESKQFPAWPLNNELQLAGVCWLGRTGRISIVSASNIRLNRSSLASWSSRFWKKERDIDRLRQSIFDRLDRSLL